MSEQYKYKNKYYSKSNILDLIHLLDNDNAIDIWGDNTFSIRGLYGVYDEGKIDKFLENLVRYRFIENEVIYKRLEEDNKIFKENNKEVIKKERTSPIDNHYDQMRAEAFNGRKIFY